jgi:hypothetical protein
MPPSNIREWADYYLSLGYHPIPCVPRQKLPRVAWTAYQTTAPTAEEWDTWAAQWPDANIALVLGRGRFAVDMDGGTAAEALLHQAGVSLPMDAPRSRTASGFHVFLSGDDIGDRVGLVSVNGGKPQVDIRGKGIVIAPPSVHPSGAQYAWEVPLRADLPGAPDSLLKLLSGSVEMATARAPRLSVIGESWISDALQGVGEGQRDATCTRLAGYLLGKGIDPETAEAMLCASFARNCVPPFDQRDVRKCVASIARKERMAGTDTPPAIEHIGAAIQRLEDQSVQGMAQPVPTPFPFLNESFDGGLRPGEMAFLGARPGVGKTAMGLEFARSAAKRGHSVLVVSREMVNTALARRMLAQEGQIAAKSLKRWKLSADERVRLADASGALSELPIWLTDQAVSLQEISTLVEGFQGLGLLIVDYLQLVRAPAGIKERRFQVEAVSSGLKTLALQYQVPTICLSSVSRSADNAPPTLASLRESGELEHDADIVIMLHRPDLNSTIVECTIHKNREGAIGRCDLFFRPEFVSFQESYGGIS